LPLPAHLEMTHAWQCTRTELRRLVGEDTFEIWLSHLALVDWDGTEVTISAPADKQAWISGRYQRVLQRCVQSAFGPQAKLVFATETTGGSQPSALRGQPRSTPAAPQLSDEAQLERFIPRYTFDQFIIGDGNRLAHAAALAVAEAPAQAYNPLFLYAPPGLGKTHLLHAIGNYITTFDPATIVRYTTVEAFTNHFMAALQNRGTDAFKHLYRDADVLLIDDVQFLAFKAKTEEEFFHTFNSLHDSGRQLVLTADRLPRQLSGLADRLRARFESGLVAELQPPNRATRIAIRVIAHHSLSGRDLDSHLAADVLDDLHPASRADTTSPISIERIQVLVAGHFKLTPEELVSARRTAGLTWPRQLAIYLARELTGAALHAVGVAFGGRNHTTVLHACKRVEERVATSAEDQAELTALRGLLTASGADRSC
jgi:chromosomal replication initiator protein